VVSIRFGLFLIRFETSRSDDISIWGIHLLVGVSSSPMEIAVTGNERRGDEELRGVVRGLFPNTKGGNGVTLWGSI
jgi:hypothetical protein